MNKKISLLLYLVILANNVQAKGILQIQSESLMSLRNDNSSKMESPFYEYFGANYSNFNKSFTFDTNFSVYANPQNSDKNNFELYLLNTSYEVIPEKLLVQLGRTADFTKSAGSLLADQLSVKYYLLDKRASLGAYGGIERDLNSDVNATENIKQIGARFDYRTAGKDPYSLESKIQKEIKSNYSEDYITIGTHGPLLSQIWGSEFLLSGEHNLTSSQSRRLELGIDLYPTMKFANRWRLLSYKSRPLIGEEHDPIFAVISKGRIYEITTLFDYLYIKHLTFSGAFSYNDYLLQQNTRAKGYRTEFNINYADSNIKLSDKVYYFQSYGGRIYGSRLNINLIMFNPYEISASADITYYKKITSADDTAISTDFMLGKNFKEFKWQLGSEFNSNNILKYDLRLLTKLTYNGWSELQ